MIYIIVIYNFAFFGYNKKVLIGVPHLSTVCQHTDFMYLLCLAISFSFHLGACHFLVLSDNRKLETYVEVFGGMIFL